MANEIPGYMMTDNSHTSVADMLGNGLIDDGLRTRIVEQIAKRQLVKHLQILRVLHNLSQEDIAEKLACPRQVVARWENGFDGDLRLRDIHAYLVALDVDLDLQALSDALMGVIDQAGKSIETMPDLPAEYEEGLLTGL